jgi:hypothetical protein
MRAADDEYGPTSVSQLRRGPHKSRSSRLKRLEGDHQMIARLLLSNVTITINGEIRRVPAIEAIVSQLQLQEMSGNPRASSLLLELRKFVRPRGGNQVELIFVGVNEAPHGVGAEKEHD